MLSTRDPLKNKGHIQTKSEGQDILLDSTLGQALDFGFCFPILKDYLLKDQGHLGWWSQGKSQCQGYLPSLDLTFISFLAWEAFFLQVQ